MLTQTLPELRVCEVGCFALFYFDARSRWSILPHLMSRRFVFIYDYGKLHDWRKQRLTLTGSHSRQPAHTCKTRYIKIVFDDDEGGPGDTQTMISRRCSAYWQIEVCHVITTFTGTRLLDAQIFFMTHDIPSRLNTTQYSVLRREKVLFFKRRNETYNL